MVNFDNDASKKLIGLIAIFNHAKKLKFLKCILGNMRKNIRHLILNIFEVATQIYI